jgi:thiol-disulfide isomerase/thioredoxin
MSLLIAVIVVLTVVTALNLLLTSAIIRKLRDPQRQSRAELPRIGAEVGSFATTSTDGESITDSAVSAGGSLVVFVSPTCPPCQRLTGELADRVEELPDPTIVFVIDENDQEQARRYADALGPSVLVAVVESHGAAAVAFGFGGSTPTLIRVRDGAVAAVGHDLDSVLTGERPVAHQVR